jgi:hypothetical protein
MTEPPILQGCKSKGAKLWTISAGNKTKMEQANNAYDIPSISQTIKYLHTAAGFPVEDTQIKAIKTGNYNTWPTITLTIVQRHFPESDEMQKGHMKKQRQGVRSTRVQDKTEPNIPALTKMKDIHINIHNATKTMHSNQTGQFSATSSRGNKYIIVLVEVDRNFIDAEPMKNKLEGAMIKAYIELWTRLTASGTVKPTTHILDNKHQWNSKRKYKRIARFS